MGPVGGFLDKSFSISKILNFEVDDEFINLNKIEPLWGPNVYQY